MRRHRNFIGPAGMGGLVSLWGASSLIKSIQRGTITITSTITGTATINPVDTNNNNTVVKYLGQSGTDNTGIYERGTAGLSLTNSTTVTATKMAATSNIVVSFEVVEYGPGTIKSIQRGIRTGSGTSTITAVDVNKSTLDILGIIGYTGNVYYADYDALRLTLTNATTITSVASNASSGTQWYWQVVEFF